MIPTRFVRALVALAFVALPALVHAAPVAPAAKNLLANPGFEKGLAGHEWMPAGWDTSDAGVSTVFFGRDTLLAHSGHYGVNIANTSTTYAMGHNWSQSLLVGREAWNKTATFTVWTRSVGQDGRAYLLLQAYRDTISKMSRIWAVDREEAARRLGIAAVNDPLAELGWDREQWMDNPDGWVKREAKIFVPPSTNMIFVRGGLMGTGQVAFDDASLTLSPAMPPAPAPANQNVLVDPSFEERGLAWEWAIPPFPGTEVVWDSTVAHTGRGSMRVSDRGQSPVATRAGVAQVIPGSRIRGKHVKLSGWFKGDSIAAECYVKLYFQTPGGVIQTAGSHSYSGTFDWTQTAIDADAPPDTEEAWAWMMFSVPATGRVWMDDATLVVTGSATSAAAKPAAPKRSTTKPASGRR